MQIVTYLGFTLLSIFIQFSVIDFIQGKLKLGENPIDLKGTSPKRQLRDVLKDISYYKPHALYFQTQKGKVAKMHTPAKLLSNSTLTNLLVTTDITTTVFDILYDENTTVTEEAFTTESLYPSTDIENVTEITFFEQNNVTRNKPDAVKKTVLKDCTCNFLHKVCDIDCCCDSDCSSSEIEMFPNCDKNRKVGKEPLGDVCYSQLPYFGYESGLFCIVKTNLPVKRNIVHHEINLTPTENFFAWKSAAKSPILYEFSNTIYKYGDLLWLFKNGSLYHFDLPSPRINNYCTGRKSVQFLKDEKYSCNVKIEDLGMLHIMKSSEEFTVISATPLSLNSSVLNCTNLHCINWTIITCNNLVCTNYSKNLHEPTCTESVCTNLALKTEYIFYYHGSKIISATIKFHVQNITMKLPFLTEEIQVKFVLANESVDRIVKLSGSPGYQEGLPIIVSYAENNYTDTFYDTSVESQRHLQLPENHNGLCISSNISDNPILFGINRRLKCRYIHRRYNDVKFGNSADECKNIQNNINKLFGLNYNILVSPLGNPQELKDKDWLALEKSAANEGSQYGKIQDRTSNLLCFNLVTRYSIIFSFAHVNGNNNNRILSCSCKTTAKNASFSIEDNIMSIVVTVDINFIDVTKPSVIAYAAGPNLNIHIPNDFFYPFRSNESRISKSNVFTMILLYYITIIVCK